MGKGLLTINPLFSDRFLATTCGSAKGNKTSIEQHFGFWMILGMDFGFNETEEIQEGWKVFVHFRFSS